MRQAIISKGKVSAQEVSAPNVNPGSLLIKVVNSCISAGTEISNVKGTKVDGLIKKPFNSLKELHKFLILLNQLGLKNNFEGSGYNQ